MQIFIFAPTQGAPPRAFLSDWNLCHSVAITFKRRSVNMSRIKVDQPTDYAGIVTTFKVYDQDTGEQLGTAYETVVLTEAADLSPTGMSHAYPGKTIKA